MRAIRTQLRCWCLLVLTGGLLDPLSVAGEVALTVDGVMIPAEFLRIWTDEARTRPPLAAAAPDQPAPPCAGDSARREAVREAVRWAAEMAVARAHGVVPPSAAERESLESERAERRAAGEIVFGAINSQALRFLRYHRAQTEARTLRVLRRRVAGESELALRAYVERNAEHLMPARREVRWTRGATEERFWLDDPEAYARHREDWPELVAAASRLSQVGQTTRPSGAAEDDRVTLVALAPAAPPPWPVLRAHAVAAWAEDRWREAVEARVAEAAVEGDVAFIAGRRVGE